MMDRDRRREAAVDVLARADLHRLEHRRHRARRAHRGAGVAALEQDRLAAVEVGGDDAERDLHLLDVTVPVLSRTNFASASPRIRPRPGYDQSANAVSSIASAIVASSRAALARGEQRGDEAAGRRADDEIGRQAVLLERLDDADVREAARGAAAERQADARPSRRRRRGRKGRGGGWCGRRRSDRRHGDRRALRSARAGDEDRPERSLAQTLAIARSASRRAMPSAGAREASAPRALSLCRIRHTEVKKLWFVLHMGVDRVPSPSRSGGCVPATSFWATQSAASTPRVSGPKRRFSIWSRDALSPSLTRLLNTTLPLD